MALTMINAIDMGQMPVFNSFSSPLLVKTLVS
jgi:hypothetical protein